MFSQTVEYALRAAVYLADQAPSGQTTDQVARATYVPAAYLSKVLQALARSGIVRSQRGVKGGFHLAKMPTEITVLDVVNAVDPLRRIPFCPLDPESQSSILYPLQERLDAAIRSVEESFRMATLASIVSEPHGDVPVVPIEHHNNGVSNHAKSS
ncbi:Rrf2 family transcriptional regulator [bacterium]|nr:Rrf2 family transcriptional regulator [bacterium]